ncbi:MAG TPA: hypothetical protein VFT26_11965, partial [Pyrinomonadaceae bacterium]|nr:hypothetical protein [Pyrinomonadaceae bacterium]
MGVLCLGVSVPALSQSGRKNEPGKPGKSRPGPIADPGRGTPSSPRRPDEIDSDDDVVRISSNLVPIPASVVDKRGNA